MKYLWQKVADFQFHFINFTSMSQKWIFLCNQSSFIPRESNQPSNNNKRSYNTIVKIKSRRNLPRSETSVDKCWRSHGEVQYEFHRVKMIQPLQRVIHVTYVHYRLNRRYMKVLCNVHTRRCERTCYTTCYIRERRFRSGRSAMIVLYMRKPRKSRYRRFITPTYLHSLDVCGRSDVSRAYLRSDTFWKVTFRVRV